MLTSTPAAMPESGPLNSCVWMVSSPGSFLMQCDGTDTNPDYVAALERYRDSGGVPYNVRGHEQIVSLYEGLEPVEPGIVQITRWRPTRTPSATRRTSTSWVGSPVRPERAGRSDPRV
jgi:S-adenosyl methyltransferase